MKALPHLDMNITKGSYSLLEFANIINSSTVGKTWLHEGRKHMTTCNICGDDSMFKFV